MKKSNVGIVGEAEKAVVPENAKWDIEDDLDGMSFLWEPGYVPDTGDSYCDQVLGVMAAMGREGIRRCLLTGIQSLTDKLQLLPEAKKLVAVRPNCPWACR